MKLSSIDPDAPVCSSGKRPFRTEAEAEKMLRQSARWRASGDGSARKPGRVEKRYYRCPACDWWHLSATSKR